MDNRLQIRSSQGNICYLVKCGHSTSNDTGVITEICRKNLTLASRLSRSLKITGTDTDRSATYDFLLVIHGPVSYRFRNKRRFRSKIAVFPIVYLRPHALRVFILEFCNGGNAQKLGSLPYKMVERLRRYVRLCRYNTAYFVLLLRENIQNRSTETAKHPPKQLISNPASSRYLLFIKFDAKIQQHIPLLQPG